MDLLTHFWAFISYFGDIAYWLGFTVSFLMIYPFLDKRDKNKQKWILYYLLPSVLLSYVSAFFLKLIFKIPRICEGINYCPETYAFPSGHATIAFAFSTIVLLWFRRKPKVYVPIFILSLLICYSRLASNVHSLSDVIAGAVIGTIISTGWYVFFKKVTSNDRSLSFYMRKLIHLSGIIIILLHLTLETKYVFGLMLFLTLAFFVSEILRIRRTYLPIIHEITNYCKKKEEKGFLIEVFLFGLSITLLLLLPSKMFLIGSLPLIVGDSLAGIVGYTFGKHKLPYNQDKTIEGSLAFFVSTLIAYLLFFDPKTSLILSMFSSLLESLLKKYENLLLPFSVVIFSALTLM